MITQDFAFAGIVSLNGAVAACNCQKLGNESPHIPADVANSLRRDSSDVAVNVLGKIVMENSSWELLAIPSDERSLLAQYRQLQ